MAGLLGRKFEVPFQENLKFFCEALKRTSKNGRAIGEQEPQLFCEALERTSKNGRAIGEQEPQMFGEALERTSKTAGYWGAGTSNVW